MLGRDPPGRRVVFLVAALLLGTAVVAGGVSSTSHLGSDGPAILGFTIDLNITVPTVSVDAPGAGDNGTTPSPGVSPLPVVPDDDRGADGASYMGRRR